MNRRNSWTRYRRLSLGITVPEILLILALIVILLSFAAPSWTGANARAELKDAVASLDLGIRMARSTARRLDTTVVMHLQTDRKSRHHGVTYSLPDLPPDSPEAALLINYELPESVRLHTNLEDVRFDPRGLVEEPAQIAMTSLHDDNLFERMLID